MEPGGSSWQRRLQSIFGLDVRSLALFRIVLGIILLFDVAIRYEDVHAFYTDEGVLPRSALPPYNLGMSVHILDGSLGFQVVLFYLHGFAALALILGWHTRYVLPLAWFLTLSVHSRNTLVLHGGDILLRLLLFWSMFLPLSANYSLDSLSRAPPPRRVVSMGTVAFILQMCMVYWFAGLLKWGNAWREDGYALYMALNVGHFTTPLGASLLEQHSLLTVLTFSTVILESCGPFLLFVPWRNWLFRLLAIFSFTMFHVSIGLTMLMGIFQPVCIAAWMIFLPGEFWDWLGRRLRRTRPAGLKFYLDAASPAGRRSARFWTTLLMVSDLEIVSSADNPAWLERTREHGAWALVEGEDRIHTGFDALRLLLRLSPLFWPLAYMAGLKPIRSLGEKLFRRGAAPSAQQQTVSPPPGELPPAFAPLPGPVNVLIGLLLLYVFVWNMNTCDEPRGPDDSFVLDKVLGLRDTLRRHFPSQFTILGRAIGLDQGWGLFGPEPGKEHGWLVAVGTLADGRQVDLRTGGPVSWAKPAFIADTYANSRWRQYLMRVMFMAPGDFGVRHFYCLYLAGDWNGAHPGADEQLQSIEVYAMVETTQPDYKPLTLEKWRLIKFDCRTVQSDLIPVRAAP